ncbi:MAG: EAL domain-containing protein, partial [Acidimicrobiaceae bacterium]|nr:EAL domain-containing protein [Acidimicrobiaceae bacterium]
NEDVQAQLHAMQATSGAYVSLLQRPMPEVEGSWSEVESTELEELSTLPGILSAAIWRLGSDGRFQLSHVSGVIKDEVVPILECSGTDPDKFSTSWRCSILSKAWNAEQVSSIVSLDGALKTAVESGGPRELAIRSAVAVPIFNGQHRVESAIELLGAFPNQFESNTMRQFIQGIQRRWAEVKNHCESYISAPFVTPGLVKQYREELFNGGLQMYMQPIVEIKTGRVVKFEALARLKTGDDLVVPPGVFLPLLGDVELDRLFRQGLDQTLTWAKRWEEQGIVVDVSVNLPPTTLLDADCQNWVRDALSDHDFDPSRLVLELLETHGADEDGQKETIEGLREIGVKLAMDDLGSGYSSLLRFSTLPFDTIKVDRGIVAQLYASPLQTLSLMGKLIQMGREFGREVVMEGLEDMGTLEAAMFLGAPLVQGYQLAYPMPPEKVESWIREFAFPASIGQIRTYLGALTYLLSAAHQDSFGDEWLAPGCIIGDFLSNQGAEAEPAMLLHLQVHREATRGQLYQRLLQWLIDKVRLSP